MTTSSDFAVFFALANSVTDFGVVFQNEGSDRATPLLMCEQQVVPCLFFSPIPNLRPPFFVRSMIRPTWS